MKSLYAQSGPRTNVVQIREVTENVPVRERTVCAASITNGVVEVTVAAGNGAACMTPAEWVALAHGRQKAEDSITMPREEGETLAALLEDVRNALHAHSLSGEWALQLTREHADVLRRRVEKALHG